MAQDERNADWDEVGRLFGELGHRLQDAWSASKPERGVAAESEQDSKKIGAALDELKTTISRTVSDPEVREAAGKAGSGLTDALAASLRSLADWVEQKAEGPKQRGGDSPPDLTKP